MKRVLLLSVFAVAFAGMAAPPPGSNADRVLARLKEVAYSPNYYWAWTHPWATLWKRNGDARFAVKTKSGYAPKPTADVTLSCEYSKYADGRLCAIGYSDLYAVAGTWWGDRYYAVNRATLTAAIRRHWHELGGINVFSWHMDHPYCTNGFKKAAYRFKSSGADRNVIRQILDGTGGPCGMDSVEGKNYRTPFPNPRAWYMAALKDIADFFNGLVDEETGEKIPVVMRYGHEMEGSWFWWGRTWCTPEEFRAFCRMTADYLRAACGDRQILFAYTPDRMWQDFGKEGDGENTYLAYYPGDEYVDIVGLDDYSIARGCDNDAKMESNLKETIRKLRLVSSFAKERGKVAALTETGGENKRDDFWVHLHRIMTAEGVHCAFVDTWSDRYGTIPETPESEKDELAFSRRPEVLMSAPGTGFRQPAQSPATGGDKIDVMAVYYPHWHRYPKGDEWFGEKWNAGEWAFVKDPKTRFKGQINFKPIAGYLDGSNPEDVETEVALASNVGINVFLYDYYWYDGQKTQEEAIEQGFLKARNRDKMKFALMWCYHERRDAFRIPYSKGQRELMSLAHTPEEFLGLIDYSIAHYFNQPEYYRKDGRLFFSIYRFTYLWETWGKDDAKVRNAIQEAKRRVRVAGLGELHVNAQGVRPEAMKHMAELGIDSFTDYGFNAYAVKNSFSRFKAGETCFDYGEIDGLLQNSWAEKRKASPVPYIPVVPTGWDSTLRCRHDVPFPWEWKGEIIYPYSPTFTNSTDALFVKYLRDAKASVLADPKKPGIVYINAWNEYTEGCWLLPDVRRGDLKLRAVARVFGRHPEGECAFTKLCPYWEGDKAPTQRAMFTVAPDFENVKYGPHERQGMDVWLPKDETPAKGGTPVVIAIHGGGWTSGDRMPDAAALVKDCRARDIALVTVGYRFIADANDQDIKPPVKACLDDAVAAIRYVQAHAAEWNIDVSRIGLTGGSAGACSSLYCALMDGNALGIRAVLANNPQTSLDPKEMREWIPNSRYGAHAFGYRNFDHWLEHREECLDQIEKYSPAALLRKCPADKAACFFYRSSPLPPPGELPKDPTHAAMFCVKFEELCKARGISCRAGTREDFLSCLTDGN